MKNKTTKTIKVTRSARVCLGLLAAASVVTLSSLPASAGDRDRNCDHDRDEEVTHYNQINLVSDISNFGQIPDTNLVNGWGIAFGAGGPFWVSDNGSGNATLYAVTNDAAGAPHVAKNARVVKIPGNAGPTGLINNTTTGFNTNAFVFVSLDGTISGWRGALGNNAEVLTTRPTAVYTGVTLATNGSSPVLLVANFREGTIDEYNSSAQLVGQFSDRHAPAGYAPYNVQNIGGTIFVTFAEVNTQQLGVLTGRGRGLIDTFNPASGTFHRFATGKAAGGNIRQLDAPWGVVLAPATFGSHANQLLVGNFGSGTIMTFDAYGQFHGLLKGSEECPVTIDGLWGLSFGGSGSDGVATDLYFTAGPNGEKHGLFGVLQTGSDDDDNGHDHDHGQRY